MAMGMGYGHTNERTGTDGANGTDGDGTVGYFKTLQPKVQCHSPQRDNAGWRFDRFNEKDPKLGS
jgi:hypothetical protein